MLASKWTSLIRQPSATFIYWLSLSLWTLAIYLTTKDASRALIASADLWIHRRWDLIMEESAVTIEQQRAIQQHYLSYGVYIPIDDIVVDARQQLSDSVTSVLQAACGKGRAYIWVPLPVHFPVIGEKVFEWCLVKV